MVPEEARRSARSCLCRLATLVAVFLRPAVDPESCWIPSTGMHPKQSAISTHAVLNVLDENLTGDDQRQPSCLDIEGRCVVKTISPFDHLGSMQLMR